MDDVKLTWATPQGDGWIAFMARVSNPKANPEDPAERLIAYLIRHKHWSPFDMVNLCIEVETTRDIGRQILRHWSIHPQEFSQRYAEVADEGIESREMRLKGSTNRQGSLDENDDDWEDLGVSHAVAGLDLYQQMLRSGIAAECARSVLSEGYTPTRMFLNGTLRSWIHYIQQRCDSHAQKEHRVVAGQVRALMWEHFPLTMKAVELIREEEMTGIERVKEFHRAFGIGAADSPREPTPAERVLRAKLLLEETMETIQKGLGIDLCFEDTNENVWIPNVDEFTFEIARDYDPVETLDGLADVKVIANGTAALFGLPMEAADLEVFRSNMSKLGEDGKPIVNQPQCPSCNGMNTSCPEGCGRDESTGELNGTRFEGERPLLDSTQPVGKVLKGPNYRKADIAGLLS